MSLSTSLISSRPASECVSLALTLTHLSQTFSCTYIPIVYRTSTSLPARCMHDIDIYMDWFYFASVHLLLRPSFCSLHHYISSLPTHTHAHILWIFLLLTSSCILHTLLALSASASSVFSHSPSHLLSIPSNAKVRKKPCFIHACQDERTGPPIHPSSTVF